MCSGIKKNQNTYRKCDTITRRWWFFAGLLLIQLLPPFTSKNVNSDEIYQIIMTTLNRALFYSFERVFPVFQGIAISVIVLLVIFRNKARGVFAIHAGVSYILFAVMQLTAITPKYGLSIIPSGIIMFGLVAVIWFWEAFSGFNDFSMYKQPIWKYFVIVPAIIAFWMPLNLITCELDFGIANLITSGSALTFCMMTPAYLAVLIFFCPMVNMVLLRITSTVGLILALYNVPKLFWPDVMWLGILHLPLLLLSIVGLILSLVVKRVCHEDK